MKESYITNWDEWKQQFHYYKEIRIVFSDLDAFGHLNNTGAFKFMELARMDYLIDYQLLQPSALLTSETFVVVADLQCDFLQQMFYDDVLKLYVQPHHVGNSSVDLHYMAVNQKGDVTFVGRGALVQISRKTGKAVKWNEAQYQVLTKENI